MFFNLLKPVTEKVIDNYLAEHCCSSQNVSKTKKKINNDLFSCYLKTASKLLNYLNIVLSGDAFEHIFFRYRPFVDYNSETFKLLNAKWRCFVPISKKALSKKILTRCWRFYLKIKKHVHIAFKIPISEYKSFDKLIDIISDEWEKRKTFFENYKMVYPRLTSSLKWKFDYVFFEKKVKNGKRNPRKAESQKSRCCVWEIYIKYYFVKISQ